MSIATKTGDDGTTSLLYGRRVSKTHPRVEAYGAVDALGSALGLCRAYCKDQPTATFLFERQRDLVLLMAELATDDADHPRFLNRKPRSDDPQRPTHICDAHLEPLEAMITRCEQDAPPFNDWLLPGENPLQAFFDLARTACRSAERQALLLRESGASVRPQLTRYLNRLSDVFWLLGREAASAKNNSTEEA